MNLLAHSIHDLLEVDPAAHPHCWRRQHLIGVPGLADQDWPHTKVAGCGRGLAVGLLAVTRGSLSSHFAQTSTPRLRGRRPAGPSEDLERQRDRAAEPHQEQRPSDGPAFVRGPSIREEESEAKAERRASARDQPKFRQTELSVSHDPIQIGGVGESHGRRGCRGTANAPIAGVQQQSPPGRGQGRRHSVEQGDAGIP